jgi:hypothetical protein
MIRVALGIPDVEDTKPMRNIRRLLIRLGEMIHLSREDDYWFMTLPEILRRVLRCWDQVIQLGKVREKERGRVLDHNPIGTSTGPEGEGQCVERGLGWSDSDEDRQSPLCDQGARLNAIWRVEKPGNLPKLEIRLKPRTVEERVEMRHEEGRLKFKKWRRFVDQQTDPSPHAHWTREDDSDPDSDSDSDSGPPSDDEEDDQLIKNGIVRTVLFHDDSSQETGGNDSATMGDIVERYQDSDPRSNKGYQNSD